MIQVYLDIETIPLPIEDREFLRPTMSTVKFGNTIDPIKREKKLAEAIQDFEAGAEAGLDELQSQIAIIGYILNDEPYKAITTEHQTERQALAAFWSCVTPFSTELEMIGHNVKQFDMPMLVHRSLLNGLKVPEFIIMDLARYDSAHIKDTMLRWTLGNRQAEYRKLKDLCAAFRIECKEGPINGANFCEYWKTDKAACIA